jgi:hypothetical protein
MTIEQEGADAFVNKTKKDIQKLLAKQGVPALLSASTLTLTQLQIPGIVTQIQARGESVIQLLQSAE